MKKYLLKLIALVLVCVFSTGCNDTPGRSASESMSEPTLQPVEEIKPEIKYVDGVLQGTFIYDSSGKNLPYDRVSAGFYARADNKFLLQNQGDKAYYVLVNCDGAEVLGERETFHMGSVATLVGDTLIFMDLTDESMGDKTFYRETFVDIENKTITERKILSQRLHDYFALNENEYIMWTMEIEGNQKRSTYVIKNLDGEQRPFLKSSVTFSEDLSTDGMLLTNACVYRNHVYMVGLNGEDYSINEYNLEGELLNVYVSDALGDFLEVTFPSENKPYKYSAYSLSRFGDYFIVQDDSLEGKAFKLENEQLIPLAFDIDMFRPAFGGKSIYDDSKLNYFYFFTSVDDEFKNKIFGLDRDGNWKCWEVALPTEEASIAGVWMDAEGNATVNFLDPKTQDNICCYFPKELFT